MNTAHRSYMEKVSSKYPDGSILTSNNSKVPDNATDDFAKFMT